ncbi:MAG: hypothetical protein CL878_06625 [Dehalococcoidia bacterium]|nr:hypothetical protein [Dehalococcoidia bacterium]
MKLVTFSGSQGGGKRVGVSQGDTIIDLAAAGEAAGLGPDAVHQFHSVKALLGAGDAGQAAARRALDFAAGQTGAWTVPAAKASLRAPIPRPDKIFLLAGNYMSHREEGESGPVEVAAVPEVFAKPVTSVIGPEDSIRLPGPICTKVDYEGELGVVIGKSARNVSKEDALSYVGGYVNFNDVSGRELDPGIEREEGARSGFFDWLIGKWFDTFAAMGPYVVTADEVADPQDLTLETRVNGDRRQYGTTADMIFYIANTIEWISKFVTLSPGDVLATGTPAGVGSVREVYLEAGDVVEVEITGLGVLSNTVAAS